MAHHIARDRPIASINSDDFLYGVLIGLQHMYLHDHETAYRECVNEVGERKLVDFARREEAYVWSGLMHYGYCDSRGRFRARRK